MNRPTPSRALARPRALLAAATAVPLAACAGESIGASTPRIAFVDLSPRVSVADDMAPEELGVQSDVTVAVLVGANQPWDRVEIHVVKDGEVTDEQLADLVDGRRAKARVGLPTPTRADELVTLHARTVGIGLEVEATATIALDP
jgi:hypothetical protein